MLPTIYAFQHPYYILVQRYYFLFKKEETVICRLPELNDYFDEYTINRFSTNDNDSPLYRIISPFTLL